MDHRVQQAVAAAEERLHEGCSSAKLAEYVNLSPSRLHQLFKQETGLPPATYLRRLRMERARGLLETTNLSVKQVMAAAGLSDESHFVRDFKKSYGLTPARYRERFLNSTPGGAASGVHGPTARPHSDPTERPEPLSSVGRGAPPLLLRRASHPLGLAAGAGVRPPGHESDSRRELLSLLSHRHVHFAELTTAITDNIVRGMTDEQALSQLQRKSAPARRRFNAPTLSTRRAYPRRNLGLRRRRPQPPPGDASPETT